MTSEESAPQRVCINGYNTLAEAKAKGLISNAPEGCLVGGSPARLIGYVEGEDENVSISIDSSLSSLSDYGSV